MIPCLTYDLDKEALSNPLGFETFLQFLLKSRVFVSAFPASEFSLERLKLIVKVVACMYLHVSPSSLSPCGIQVLPLSSFAQHAQTVGVCADLIFVRQCGIFQFLRCDGGRRNHYQKEGGQGNDETTAIKVVHIWELDDDGDS